MFCTKCGAQNTEGAVFCVSCGNRLEASETAAPQPQYQPPAMQGYQGNTYYQPQQAYEPRRANSRKGLIIGLIAGGVVLVGAIILIIVLTGGQPAGNGVIGMWYDEQGYAGTLDFHSGGTVDMSAAGMQIPAEYTFDEKTGRGEIGFYGSMSEFTIEGGVLNLDGTRYTRRVVEQFDLSDIDLSDFNFDLN